MDKKSSLWVQSNRIEMVSDDKSDYISLNDMAKTFKGSVSIENWIKAKDTLRFLTAWEKINNPNFKPVHLDGIKKMSVGVWVQSTSAIGIFARQGKYDSGTFAHKDIAFKFAGWLSPEFELYVAQEFQKLKDLERKKRENELLDREQILFLSKLKEVFKYVIHQDMIKEAHADVFASKNAETKRPYDEFNRWRNKILEVGPKVIEERIRKYCEENGIQLTKRIDRKNRKEKALMMDSYSSVRNAVWDFLKIQGNVNALNLANLVKDMIAVENGEVLRSNEDDLFHTKQDLGEYTEFKKYINGIKEVKTARELLERKVEKLQSKQPSGYNQLLKKALNYDPKGKK